jgi:seryl-tRNA synthetase
MIMPADTLKGLDIKLNHIQMRLNDLYVERNRMEEELQRKGLGTTARKLLKARLETIANQIKAGQEEEWNVDDKRYDALYYPKTK